MVGMFCVSDEDFNVVVVLCCEVDFVRPRRFKTGIFALKGWDRA
jgi:hypothetical protein